MAYRAIDTYDTNVVVNDADIGLVLLIPDDKT